MLAANSGMRASVTAPVTGLHIAVPPLWHMLTKRECISLKMTLGYICSFFSLVLYSGALSDTSDMPSEKISGSEWVICFMGVLTWGIGLVTQDFAGGELLFQQFPQSQTWYTLGFAVFSFIVALAVGPSDLVKYSNWIPFTNDQGLMVLSTFFMGVGTGFFSLSMSYAEDLNLVVGLSSMFVTIPTVLGLFFLHEPATWNILFGLVLVCSCMAILSLEALSKDMTPLTPFHSVLNSSTFSRAGYSTSNSKQISIDLSCFTDGVLVNEKTPLLKFSTDV